ncbi:hypothetical protein P9228_25135 [Mesorhizobium sp. WSM4898]|uniref:hypothetical protein n=1 Tax=Mesorhizobium sp. WSM4898 TaxID=3038544 RepID=UPI0024151FC1|nr:hypothetical protein [Mesorhizobium sp. WSM4898]MDG4909673.1 hypothetical protein [Mesorhizobium sp. WSM4898]
MENRDLIGTLSRSFLRQGGRRPWPIQSLRAGVPLRPRPRPPYRPQPPSRPASN